MLVPKNCKNLKDNYFEKYIYHVQNGGGEENPREMQQNSQYVPGQDVNLKEPRFKWLPHTAIPVRNVLCSSICRKST